MAVGLLWTGWRYASPRTHEALLGFIGMARRRDTAEASGGGAGIPPRWGSTDTLPGERMIGFYPRPRRPRASPWMHRVFWGVDCTPAGKPSGLTVK